MSHERLNILLKAYEAEVRDVERRIPIILPFLSLIIYVIGIIWHLINWQPYIEDENIFSLSLPLNRDNIIARVGIEDNDLQMRPFIRDNILIPSISITILLAMFIVLGYMIYRWIDTMNKHLSKITKLYSIVVEIAEVLDFKRSSIIKSRFNELTIANINRNIALNIVLGILIPFYIFYIFHFTNKGLANHGRYEKLFLIELIDDIKSRDTLFSKSIIDYKQVEEKSTLIYIILSIITLGIFAVYWAYSLTKDYNEHIINHQILDNAILEGLKRISI